MCQNVTRWHPTASSTQQRRDIHSAKGSALRRPNHSDISHTSWLLISSSLEYVGWHFISHRAWVWWVGWPQGGIRHIRLHTNIWSISVSHMYIWFYELISLWCCRCDMTVHSIWKICVMQIQYQLYLLQLRKISCLLICGSAAASDRLSIYIHRIAVRCATMWWSSPDRRGCWCPPQEHQIHGSFSKDIRNGEHEGW